ncbi:glycosyltransferase [Thiorhodovibrio litoralis]|uniref:glycosyltransferase n=1 Tax=Thiorhodovibrio litoralis TaxID=2952932 RepID=UPI002B262AAA|nr:glycosyltransferase [Thiorhodovibrio litoralis]
MLYSGNIGRKQGLDQLIDLAARLQQRQVQATVIIRGDGNDRETLQQQAAAQALSNLRFEPLCPAERLAEGLAEGHIHLVPQNPAVPDSPLDQLRAASDAFVTCPPNDPTAFADAVERLLANPAERARLGANGRAYVERHAGRVAALRAYDAVITNPLDPSAIHSQSRAGEAA